MIVIDDLQSVTTDSTTLQNYLSDNFQEVYDFFSHTPHTSLIESREKINRYIALNRGVILQLDISNKTNLAFISLLLDISERLGLIASFRFLFEHLQGKDYDIGIRLKAASQYLIGVTNADDYLNRYDSIYSQLQSSFETEEDNADKVLMTLANYYAEVVNNFGHFHLDAVRSLNSKIKKSKIDFEFSFLNHPFIDDILKIDLVDFALAYQTIHSKLDSFLGRDIPLPALTKDFLIESGTDYVDLLQAVPSDFRAIRELSVQQYNLIRSDSIFHSLQRGVAVITEEKQLYAYMYSFGKMHYTKLIDSFNSLPTEFFEKEISIVDWGCGQGMATMTFIDFLNQKKLKQEIKSVTLIEPSEIASKRASLNVKKLHATSKIITVNKYLDSVTNDDFENKKLVPKLHLFSNILDIDLFSLTNLLSLINTNFAGENYFVCVSPFVNDTRTSRLNSFVKYFSKEKDFAQQLSIDNRKEEWQNGWTRVIRVFKATLK